MASELSKVRVAVWTLLFALAVVAAGVTLRPKPAVAPRACAPLPTNLKVLGSPLSGEGIAAAVAHRTLSRELAAKASEPGTTVHLFETAVTGGYLVLHGRCVVEQEVNWIR